jgi:hypothetical protein
MDPNRDILRTSSMGEDLVVPSQVSDLLRVCCVDEQLTSTVMCEAP